MNAELLGETAKGFVSNELETIIPMPGESRDVAPNVSKGRKWGRTWVQIYKVSSGIIAIVSGGVIVYGVVQKQNPTIILGAIEAAFAAASAYLAHQFEKLLPLNEVTKKLEKDDDDLTRNVRILGRDEEKVDEQIKILKEKNEELNQAVQSVELEKQQLGKEIESLTKERTQLHEENQQLKEVSKKIEFNVGDFVKNETNFKEVEKGLEKLLGLAQQKEEELLKKQQLLVQQLEEGSKAIKFMEVVRNHYSATFKNAMEMYMGEK